MKKILITGVSGYIGSCLFYFLKDRFKILGLDKKQTEIIPIKHCNLLDKKKLNYYLKSEKPDLVIHLAAQSLVDETINKNKYYSDNILATKNLVFSMKKNNINNIIFSSTAALYKFNNKILTEKSAISPKSTYAKTKLHCEKIIKDSSLNSIILRFFNVCSSLTIKKKIIGEFHKPETHLIPTIVYKNICKKKIYIYGNNYNTKDGTCVRDYVHIKDICSAIKKSINYLLNNNNKFEIINISSSSKKTNFEILNTIQKITKIDNIYEVVKRRSGDVDYLTCSKSKAKLKLKWSPVYSNINRIIKDEIKWVHHLLKNKKFRKFKNYL
ncbi:NAD-dependent epimerase/dehydratase family protein [Candidatus Pelagibacter sp.]|nr:NAD-dependent epimerase/dehydratase family protein [Candidatus Pelagibacter sp.]